MNSSSRTTQHTEHTERIQQSLPLPQAQTGRWRVVSKQRTVADVTSEPHISRSVARLENDRDSLYELVDDFRTETLRRFDQVDDFRTETLRRFDQVDDFRTETLRRLDRIEGGLSEVLRRLPGTR